MLSLVHRMAASLYSDKDQALAFVEGYQLAQRLRDEYLRGESPMKRLLLITASVLAFAGAGQAEAPPKAMLGGWCAAAKGTAAMIIGKPYLCPRQNRDRRTIGCSPRARLRRGDRGGPSVCRFISIQTLGTVPVTKVFVTAQCQATEETEKRTEESMSEAIRQNADQKRQGAGGAVSDPAESRHCPKDRSE